MSTQAALGSPAKRTPSRWQWAAILFGLACVLTGCYAAWIYPNNAVAGVVFVMGLVLGAGWPRQWLAIALGLLPLMSFAAYTGSVYVEETDILTLGLLAGAYARSVVLHETRAYRVQVSIGTLFLVVVLAASDLHSAMSHAWGMGRLPAMALSSDYGAFNGIRVSKPIVLALFALPLMCHQAGDGHHNRRLAVGMIAALSTIVLAGLWERITFIGLLDLANQWRISGPFWEMHVGGAALDGALALTFPFALWLALKATNRAARLAALLLVGAALYVVLTTFSRALYAAILVSSFFLLAFALREGHRELQRTHARLGAWPAVVIAALLVPVFAAGGYRSLGAALIAASCVLVTFGRQASTASIRLPRVLLIAAAIATAAWAGALLYGKASYVAFALIFAVWVFSFWGEQRHPGNVTLSHSAALALPAGTLAIAYYWGGEEAFLGALPVSAVVWLLALHDATARRPFWTFNGASGTLGGVIALIACAIAVALPGYGVSTRFATASEDLDGRIEHWRRSVAMVPNVARNWFGRGVGSFAAEFLADPRTGELPGSFEFIGDRSERVLRIGGARTDRSYGELLRFGQQIPTSSDGPFEATFAVRADAPAALALQVCQRHYIYEFACLRRDLPIPATDNKWMSMTAAIDQGALEVTPWYLWRPRYFTLAVTSTRGVVDIKQLDLVGNGGGHLLRNTQFDPGRGGWFFTSDRDHLPWQPKNLWLYIWFEQGWMGLGALAVIVLVMLTRSLQAGRMALVSSMLGLLVVSMFDSLLNVPRVAFLFYIVLFSGVLRFKARSRSPGR